MKSFAELFQALGIPAECLQNPTRGQTGITVINESRREQAVKSSDLRDKDIPERQAIKPNDLDCFKSNLVVGIDSGQIVYTDCTFSCKKWVDTRFHFKAKAEPTPGSGAKDYNCVFKEAGVPEDGTYALKFTIRK